jgi:hypothetical protein
MTTPVRLITLEGLADGAAAELFEAALKQVLINIQDPNTGWKAPREIGLRFRFSVDEDRSVGDVEIQCQTKLAGVKGVKTNIVYGNHLGELVAVEQPRQQEFFQPAPAPRLVSTMTGVEGGQP